MKKTDIVPPFKKKKRERGGGVAWDFIYKYLSSTPEENFVPLKKTTKI